MTNHDCPGLAGCLDHPRWHVWKSTERAWVALGPGYFLHAELGLFPTWEQALNHAQAVKNWLTGKENKHGSTS